MPQIATSAAPSDTVIQSKVNDYLLEFCQAEARRAHNLHTNYGRLWDTITDCVQAGGKRLRPKLAIAAYQAFGGNDEAAIIPVAAAWELIHVAFLMHDDVIDRDYIRHGEPNIGGAYLQHYAGIKDKTNRTHYAHSSAILAGDLMVSAAYRLIIGGGFRADQAQKICDLLYDAIFTTVGGELLDVEVSTKQAEASPQLIAETKTANYSLIGPLLSGAILAEANEAAQQRLRKLGMVLGVGYQFVDDVLGIYGDEAVTGKPTGSDLEEGKRTFVVVEALALMSPADRVRAELLLSQPSSVSAAELRILIDKTAITTTIADRVAGYQQQAYSLVRQLGLNQPYQSTFEQFVALLLDRRS